MGSLEEPHIDGEHGQRIIAAKFGHASGAKGDNVGVAGCSLGSKLGDCIKQDGRAFSAALWIFECHLVPDWSTADGGDDHVDNVAILSANTFSDRGDIVSVALYDLEIGRGPCREDGFEL